MLKDPGTNFLKGFFPGLIPFALVFLAPDVLQNLGFQTVVDFVKNSQILYIIYIVLFIITLVYPFALVFFRVMRRRIYERKVMETGIDAEAEILEIHQTGLNQGNGASEQIGVILELKVIAEDKAPYFTKTGYYIPLLRIPQFQPGKMVGIKINPDNFYEVIINRKEKYYDEDDV